MSSLCGGDENIFKDIFWLVIYVFKKDKSKCPRCGRNAFQHGYPSHDDEYCTHCHLWEPDWDKLNKQFEDFKKEHRVIP